MRANLIWYVPLCGAVLLLLVVPDAVSGYNNVALAFHRFSWAIFVSPAAYLFFCSVLASVFLPIQLTLAIPAFFRPDAPAFNRRYAASFGIVVATVIACLILQLLIWGSFPLPVDREGYIHVRMIPFLPWPDTPLFNW